MGKEDRFADCGPALKLVPARADNGRMHTDPTDVELLTALMNAFGHTPDTVEGRATQINYALAAGDARIAAGIVFDQVRDTGAPKTALDPHADSTVPYPDLAPFGTQGLAQFIEALAHLGLALKVVPVKT
ncbi:hypothetical protein [Paraburkholderia sp.]|uniref:hypothetical protein n=1 Tax=Paraburkholderia sp. TaxID=1926495 RepID=UPI00238D0B3F|nr:hypothetical protein [Paraburkholderia sp.]MDE1182850.1 hypothetical protein [Paraburkholderia sp.]